MGLLGLVNLVLKSARAVASIVALPLPNLPDEWNVLLNRLFFYAEEGGRKRWGVKYLFRVVRGDLAILLKKWEGSYW